MQPIYQLKWREPEALPEQHSLDDISPSLSACFILHNTSPTLTTLKLDTPPLLQSFAYAVLDEGVRFENLTRLQLQLSPDHVRRQGLITQAMLFELTDVLRLLPLRQLTLTESCDDRDSEAMFQAHKHDDAPDLPWEDRTVAWPTWTGFRRSSFTFASLACLHLRGSPHR